MCGYRFLVHTALTSLLRGVKKGRRCGEFFPPMRRITIKRARTWHYRKMPPCIEPSNDLAPLSAFRSWPGCIINTFGYDFWKGQECELINGHPNSDLDASLASYHFWDGLELRTLAHGSTLVLGWSGISFNFDLYLFSTAFLWASVAGSSALSCIKFKCGLNCAKADPLSAIKKTVQLTTKTTTEFCRKLIVIMNLLELYTEIDFGFFDFCIFQIYRNIPRQGGRHQAGLWRCQAIQ